MFTPANQKASVLQVFQEECNKQKASLHTVEIDRSCQIISKILK